MKPLGLLLVGVVVAWAASGVDWSRVAVGGDNVPAAGEASAVDLYRALTRVQIEELGGRKNADGIIGAHDLKYLTAGLNALAADGWSLVTIEQAHQYTITGPVGSSFTNPATYIFERRR